MKIWPVYKWACSTSGICLTDQIQVSALSTLRILPSAFPVCLQIYSNQDGTICLRLIYSFAPPFLPRWVNHLLLNVNTIGEIAINFRCRGQATVHSPPRQQPVRAQEELYFLMKLKSPVVASTARLSALCWRCSIRGGDTNRLKTVKTWSWGAEEVAEQTVIQHRSSWAPSASLPGRAA